MKTPEKLKIFTITMPMAIKLVKVMVYNEQLSPIKSHNSLITWSCEHTFKEILSILQCQWPSKLTGWWYTNQKVASIKLIDPLIM